MGFRRRLATAPLSLSLTVCGAVGFFAWRAAMWGLLTGAVLAAVWLGALIWRSNERFQPVGYRRSSRETGNAEEAMVLRVLLDSTPNPLLTIDGGVVRTLNRAARAMFATDDRVLPSPQPLLDRETPHLFYEGRNWRIDRVDAPGLGRMIISLIDIEREERAAEARAATEMVQVLGHELLNSLAPIVSLADSALTIATRPNQHHLLPEILGTLVRRMDSLQRFTEAYRELARLPAPKPGRVQIDELIADSARLFESRWPTVRLDVEISGKPVAQLDRDQMGQAIWAVLQNAAEASLAGDRPPAVRLLVHEDAASVMMEISDTGAGLPVDQVPRVFRPFHTTKGDGTGIGLTLSLQIARAHGGTLTLVAATDTTFQFVIPKDGVDAGPHQATRSGRGARLGQRRF